jgi:NadR type nicotinamide-nucleotide adenylyltransferase
MNLDREPRRVVLIGPECTGKTFLAAYLAEWFDLPWSEEYARQFVEDNPRDVAYADVDAIGLGQQRLEDEAVATATQLGTPAVIHDTDLVSTTVYSRHYYDNCPTSIERAACARVADLYLLHDVDVPWTEDGFQRAQPERRQELFDRFQTTLAGLGAKVVVVSGSWKARREIAIAAVGRLLGQ